jgi:hypothetical protein
MTSSSFTTIDIPNTGKQLFYNASNAGLYVALYHPKTGSQDEYLEKLFSNK